MSGPGARYRELARLPGRELETLLRNGKAPGSLAGWEFRGYNTPFFASLLGIRKFVKGFFMGNGLEGYNIPVRQNGLTGEWLHKPSAETPHRFGFYLVRGVRAEDADNLYPNAVLLDYGRSPRNPAWKPERVLRDYLVQPDPDNPDVLLGKAYLALGARIPTSFFILERLRRTEWAP